MARNKIADLRNHLFAAIEGLMDEENPMELDRARAIAEVAQVIVNSAKIECDYLKITGSGQVTGFIESDKKVL
jgi:hypothetical protein